METSGFVPASEAADLAGRWSAIADLGGAAAPVVGIDLRATSRAAIGVERHDAMVPALVASPWVNVAIVDSELDPSLHELADACDIVLGQQSGLATAVDVEDPQAELARLHAAVEASPEAAVGLVQLLRISHGLEVEAALHAESLTYAVLQSGEVFTRWLHGRDRSTRAESGAAEVVQVERRGGLLEIWLARPERRNAVSVAMRDQLTQALELLDADRSLDGAVLRGRGPSFSAGGDLDEFGTTPSPAVGHRVRTLRSLPRLVHHVRDRLRVHVHGPCVGAGIELPAFAHAVIADPDTTFRLPEVGFGLVPGAGGTVSITRRCGRHRTAWWAISGVTLDATTALAWNLVDRLEPSPGGE